MVNDILFNHLRNELFRKILSTKHTTFKFCYLTKDNEKDIPLTYQYLMSLNINYIKIEFKYKHGDQKYYYRVWIHTLNSSHLVRDGFSIMIDFPDNLNLTSSEVDRLRIHKVIM